MVNFKLFCLILQRAFSNEDITMDDTLASDVSEAASTDQDQDDSLDMCSSSSTDDLNMNDEEMRLFDTQTPTQTRRQAPCTTRDPWSPTSTSPTWTTPCATAWSMCSKWRATSARGASDRTRWRAPTSAPGDTSGLAPPLPSRVSSRAPPPGSGSSGPRVSTGCTRCVASTSGISWNCLA